MSYLTAKKKYKKNNNNNSNFDAVKLTFFWYIKVRNKPTNRNNSSLNLLRNREIASFFFPPCKFIVFISFGLFFYSIILFLPSKHLTILTVFSFYYNCNYICCFEVVLIHQHLWFVILFRTAHNFCLSYQILYQ